MSWKAKAWPIAVIAILALTVLANVLILWAASDREAEAIEPDYYHKAVAWDSTLALRRASAALGWRLEARLEDAGAGGTWLAVALRDAQGAPLGGVTLAAEAIHNAEPLRPVTARLVTQADGTARARLALGHPGVWELRFLARRGSAEFVETLHRERGGAAR